MENNNNIKVDINCSLTNFQGVTFYNINSLNITSLQKSLNDNKINLKSKQLLIWANNFEKINKIQGIEPLGRSIENGDLSNLTTLNINFEYNQIESIEPLAKAIENVGLSNLTTFQIDFENNIIESIEILGRAIENGGLANLTTLNINFSYNQIESIEPLFKAIEKGGLSKLITLNINFQNNQIESIEPIQKAIENGGLSNLITLCVDFQDNLIKSIEPLVRAIENDGLSNLTSLDINFRSNKIQSFETLGKAIENGSLSNLTILNINFMNQKDSEISFYPNILIPKDKTLKLSKCGREIQFIEKKIEDFSQNKQHSFFSQERLPQNKDIKTLKQQEEYKQKIEQELYQNIKKELEQQQKLEKENQNQIISELKNQIQTYKLKEDKFQQEIQQLKAQNQDLLQKNQIQLQQQKEELLHYNLIEIQNEKENFEKIEKLKEDNKQEIQQLKEFYKKNENKLQKEIQQLKKQNKQLWINNQTQIQQLIENEQKIQKILKKNDDQPIKQIQNQNLPQFDSLKDEILQNWNISKQLYQVDYKPLEEFEKKFKIRKQIAKGSYGQIHELQILDLEDQQFQNQEYIVKVLSCKDKKESIQVKEALIFQQINFLPQKYRQYIISTQGTYWDHKKNQIYIIQSKAKHSLLKEIKNREKQNKFYNTIELQYQLGCSLLGLVTLDTLGIAHRDIKPDNILVMNDGSIRIADLGEGKKLQYQFQVGTIHQGTPQYWSPEKYKNYLELQRIYQLKNKDKKSQFYDDEDYLKVQELTEKDQSKSDLYSIGQCFLEATLLLRSVQQQHLDQDGIERFQEKRKEQHQNIFLVLRNDPEKQQEVIEALETLGLELSIKSIPKLNPSLINLLEKILNEEASERISLEEALEELVQIQDW